MHDDTSRTRKTPRADQSLSTLLRSIPLLLPLPRATRAALRAVKRGIVFPSSTILPDGEDSRIGLLERIPRTASVLFITLLAAQPVPPMAV